MKSIFYGNWHVEINLHQLQVRNSLILRGNYYGYKRSTNLV